MTMKYLSIATVFVVALHLGGCAKPPECNDPEVFKVVTKELFPQVYEKNAKALAPRVATLFGFSPDQFELATPEVIFGEGIVDMKDEKLLKTICHFQISTVTTESFNKIKANPVVEGLLAGANNDQDRAKVSWSGNEVSAIATYSAQKREGANGYAIDLAIPKGFLYLHS